jgi:hypothetical protein
VQTVESGLRLDNEEDALKGGESGKAIVPGDPEKSLILQRITHSDRNELMPPPEKKDRLKPEQVALIRKWIGEGAEWGKHWAFVAPQRPAVPAVKDTAWVKNPIDRFVLAKLEQQGAAPSAEAAPATLLRRFSLDLTGLPPSPEELSAPFDFNKEVARLIDSPHFAERWAREWLDAARDSDSSGYEKDLPRRHHFYRDWVVGAIHSNMAYDEFVVKQIAGDLLPDASQADRIATGFLRNSMTNEEGGAKPEQFRIEDIFDRIDAIGKSMLGLTAQCAQCHTHKFDPLQHEEYNGDLKTAWTHERDPARDNDPAVLTFELAEPFHTGGTVHFKYDLVQRHGGFNSDDNHAYNLGRIRLSVAATLPNALDQLPPPAICSSAPSPTARKPGTWKPIPTATAARFTPFASAPCPIRCWSPSMRLTAPPPACGAMFPPARCKHSSRSTNRSPSRPRPASPTSS